ncbi:hypothetical protein PENSPDRAFT_759072 [Peniophora sp. CONT]|nr:hypothetical protein PENSPDRAFT_759072 [Peniophora sp. CONT]
MSDPDILGIPGVPTWRAASVFSLLFSGIMLGIITEQVSSYGARYPKDTRLLKFWVYSLWIMSVAGTAFDAYNAWTIDEDIFIYLSALVAWSAVTQATIASVAEIMVQLFFVRTVWRVGRQLYPSSRWTTVICFGLCFIGLASFTTTMTSLGLIDRNSDSLAQNLLLVKLFLDFALDCGITIALVVMIHENRSDFPSYKLRRDNFVRDLVVFIVSRGVGLVICQILAVVKSFKLFLSASLLIVTSCIPKIYVWTFLVAVMNRQSYQSFRSSVRGQDTRQLTAPQLSSVIIPDLEVCSSPDPEMAQNVPANQLGVRGVLGLTSSVTDISSSLCYEGTSASDNA